MEFAQGQLLYCIPNRHKQSGSRYYFRTEKLVLGRVADKPDVGYYLQDFEDMQYKIKLASIPGSESIGIFKVNEPRVFPMQTKTVLEKVKEGTVDWRTIKDIEIVILTFQDCNLETRGTAGSSGNKVTYELLSGEVLVVNGFRKLARDAESILITQTPLRPIHATLVGVRRHMKQRYPPLSNDPIDMATDFKMVVRFPPSSWLPTSNPGAASLGTYYLTARAMCCVWFKDDYDEWLKTQEKEKTDD